MPPDNETLLECACLLKEDHVFICFLWKVGFLMAQKGGMRAEKGGSSCLVF